MKKVWSMPTLEILDINQTMGGFDTDDYDGIFVNARGIESDSTGSDTSHSKWTYVGIP